MHGKTDNVASEVGLVLYPGAQEAAIRGLTDLFLIADRQMRRGDTDAPPALRVSHYDSDARRAFDSAPRSRGTPRALVLPPSVEDPLAARFHPPMATWLHARHGDGVLLAGVCSGVFALASSGALGGRLVTAHGMYAQELARRHPDIRVEADRGLLDDGPVVTGAGLMSWTAVGLRLVERLLGSQVMLDTARYMQVDPPGVSDTEQHVFAPGFDHGDAAVLRVQHRLHRAGTQWASIATMSGEAGLGERTFLRRFQKATGMSPTAYCQHLRVAEACSMLGSTRWPIDRIAYLVGYEDTGSFRRIFLRITGKSPGDYRRQPSM